jgi:transcriptional regulator with XRE-family HTH domain
MTPRELFKLLKARKGLSVLAIAKASGQASRQTALSRWLSDPTHDIRTETLAPIARVLEVPLEALLTDHAATQYAHEHGLSPAAPALEQGLKVYRAPVRKAPNPSLPAALAQVRAALLAVPADQRVAAVMTLMAQLGDSTVPPSTVAATLEAAARKHRRA